jgi:hypothetical protein
VPEVGSEPDSRIGRVIPRPVRTERASGNVGPGPKSENAGQIQRLGAIGSFPEPLGTASIEGRSVNRRRQPSTSLSYGLYGLKEAGHQGNPISHRT